MIIWMSYADEYRRSFDTVIQLMNVESLGCPGQIK